MSKIEQSEPLPTASHIRDLPVNPADGQDYGHLAGDKPASINIQSGQSNPFVSFPINLQFRRDKILVSFGKGSWTEISDPCNIKIEDGKMKIDWIETPDV